MDVWKDELRRRGYADEEITEYYNHVLLQSMSKTERERAIAQAQRVVIPGVSVPHREGRPQGSEGDREPAGVVEAEK